MGPIELERKLSLGMQQSKFAPLQSYSLHPMSFTESHMDHHLLVTRPNLTRRNTLALNSPLMNERADERYFFDKEHGGLKTTEGLSGHF